MISQSQRMSKLILENDDTQKGGEPPSLVTVRNSWPLFPIKIETIVINSIYFWFEGRILPHDRSLIGRFYSIDRHRINSASEIRTRRKCVYGITNKNAWSEPTFGRCDSSYLQKEKIMGSRIRFWWYHKTIIVLSLLIIHIVSDIIFRMFRYEHNYERCRNEWPNLIWKFIISFNIILYLLFCVNFCIIFNQFCLVKTCNHK